MLDATQAAVCAVLSLDGNDWQIVSSIDDLKTPPQAGTAAHIAATVPGNIQSDLEAAHELNPLWYGAGDERLWDVARRDWWYLKSFDVSADFAGRRVTLDFHGVDFECEVWLNGARIGANRGTFRRFMFDVAEHLKPGETNTLAVKLARMPEELFPYLKNSDGTMSGAETEFFFVYANNQIRRVLKELKSPATCAYDWGVNIWTLGIWRSVRLVATGATRIDWMRVRTAVRPDHTQATVRVRVETDSLSAAAVRAQFEVIPVEHAGRAGEASVTRELAAGSGVIEGEVTLEQPALWWPSGHGAQPLYDVITTLFDAASGDELATQTTRIGVREVRWEQVEGAAPDFINPFRLVLNGRPIRMMGANMVAPDLMFARIPQRGNWLMEMAHYCGMNTLRLNGAGVPLPPTMLRRADELGIMLCFEFPTANCLLESDPDFLENMEATLRNLIRQVENHPSIIEYGGGNELSWKQGDDWPALELMKRVTAEEDTRIFRATCPMEGSRHSPWTYDRKTTYAHYDNEALRDNLEINPMMRYGEFGTHTPANIEVWHREIPPASQWPICDYDDPALVRKNVMQAVFSDEFWLAPFLTEDLFGICPDLETMIKAGQFMGGEGLRYSMDALRRRGKRLGSFTTWNLNEPFTNGAGSFVVDHDGRTLMNFDFAHQGYAPVCLNIRQPEGILYDAKVGLQLEFWLVSDQPETVHGTRWQWKARDRRGHVFAQESGSVAAIEPMQALKLKQVTLHPPEKTQLGPLFLELQVHDAQGELLTERLHVFGHAGIRGPLGGLLKWLTDDRDDDTPDARLDLQDPKNPHNLAYVGNGAAQAVTSGGESLNDDPASYINDGIYGYPHSWNGTHPGANFQIDLGKLTDVGYFKVGRDRVGFANTLKARTPDYLKIEVSADGTAWTTVFEERRLAGYIADRTPGTHYAAWPPTLESLQEYLAYAPIWTLHIDTAPQRARYVKVTVDAKPGAVQYPSIDEFEVYAPRTEQERAGKPSFYFLDKRELNRPVTRTLLRAQAGAVRVEGDEELLPIEVENLGTMTALFVEPHPLLNYRTDLKIDNKNVSIPPGEKRTLLIRARLAAKLGLSLAQTGWRITAWNADPLTIEPAASLLAAFGRHDFMTREYAGYATPQAVRAPQQSTLSGRLPDVQALPYLLPAGGSLAWSFAVPAAAQAGPARLRLHSADQSRDGASLEVRVNAWSSTLNAPAGHGLQLEDPAHLAEPQTLEIELPTGTLAAANTLEVRVSSGWISWDAADIVSLA